MSRCVEVANVREAVTGDLASDAAPQQVTYQDRHGNVATMDTNGTSTRMHEHA